MDIPGSLAWIASGALALLGSWITILNYSAVVSSYRHGRHHSLIPLLGGVGLAAAMLLIPLPRVAKFAWLPLVIDLGCLYALVGLLYAVVVQGSFRNKGGRKCGQRAPRSTRSPLNSVVSWTKTGQVPTVAIAEENQGESR